MKKTRLPGRPLTHTIEPDKSAGAAYIAFTIVAVSIFTGCQRKTNENDSGAQQSAHDEVKNQSTNTPSPAPNIDPENVSRNIAPASRIGHDRMVKELQRVSETALKSTSYLGTERVDRLREELQGMPAGDNLKKYGTHIQLAGELLRLGNESEAIENYRTAQSMYKGLVKTMPRENAVTQLKRLHMATAVAYLRWGETQNCCKRNASDSCILPIRGNGVHTDTRGSKAAIHHLQAILSASRHGDEFYFQAKWLLNIANMTIGQYPANVPSEFLIPPAAFDSSPNFPSFRNVASSLGVDTYSLSGGVVADDLNGDDQIDLFVTSYHPLSAPNFFRSVGSGNFIDDTKTLGLHQITGGLNAIQADYDNDGDVDILVLRGGWFGQHGDHPNSLLQNQGDGSFIDATFDAGLGEQHYPTQTAVWFDYDNDGHVDLFVGNEADDSVAAPCQLFQNNGDGTFQDRARAAGVTNDRFSKGVSAADFDNDGNVDLYVSNLGQPNRLYRNLGDGTFRDIAQSAGVETPLNSFPAWFWDVNNDGNADLYVSNYSASIEHLSFEYSGFEHQGQTQKLYLGNGQGGFKDVTEAMQLDRPTLPMGSNFGDLDNDGYPDFYLGTGNPEYSSIMPNVMYLNDGGKRFVDVTTSGRFGHLQKGHGVAFLDFDADGDVDVFEQMGGAYPGDKFYDAMFENPGFGNHWLVVKLVGVKSNRSAIGARIRVDVQVSGTTRSKYATVNSGGSFGSNPLRQHIGLGPCQQIARVEIYWPTTKRHQSFKDVPMDCTIEIIESSSEFRVLSRT